ncbi:hypothetical protein F8154_01800 [Alkaliphilus pronyensis]|uniref:DUF2784 domain-containing protein n=1 Tax=Alkaliphilus pronyensis TaxID=1482732 RepID=A0A6I0FJF2_9FIRM|nr:hypothetical protein [Alkaliphilus pronyensis]KAB3538538.1 hypothetical protein F8154_01800 [Alkaliphilus pronyensis]
MSKKLFCIKLIHTVIWIFYVFIIGYILYAGINNKIDIFLFIAIGLVVLEGIVLLAFKWKCPLTVLGYKYTDNREIGFDIFLPKWVAKNNKVIFTAIFVVGLLITLYRLL